MMPETLEKLTVERLLKGTLHEVMKELVFVYCMRRCRPLFTDSFSFPVIK